MLSKIAVWNKNEMKVQIDSIVDFQGSQVMFCFLIAQVKQCAKSLMSTKIVFQSRLSKSVLQTQL